MNTVHWGRQRNREKEKQERNEDETSLSSQCSKKNSRWSPLRYRPRAIQQMHVGVDSPGWLGRVFPWTVRETDLCSCHERSCQGNHSAVQACKEQTMWSPLHYSTIMKAASHISTQPQDLQQGIVGTLWTLIKKNSKYISNTLQ